MKKQNGLSQTEDLFRRGRNVDLILLLERITQEATGHWLDTSGKDVEQVTAIRDEYLLPAIRRLGRLCLDAIRFRNSIVFAEGLERLAWAYDLGKQTDLQAEATSRERAVAPALYSIAQLYAVGAYAIFRRRMECVRQLLVLQAHDQRNNLVPLLSHPHWYETWSHDSNPSRFDQARTDISDSPESAHLFLGDQRQVALSLSEFDFLVSFYLYLHKLRKVQYFAQFPKTQITPILQLLLNQDTAKELFPRFSPDQLAEFLRSTNSEATYSTASRWHFTDWPKPIEEFLQQYHSKEA